VLILLSLSPFSSERLTPAERREISLIASLNLSPYFPFLSLSDLNNREFEPTPIYPLSFNVELGALLNRSNTFLRPIVVNQKFSNINFEYLSLTCVTFFNVEFVNVSFAYAYFPKTIFINCKFSNVNFNMANLQNAIFWQDDLSSTDLTSTYLAMTHLNNAFLASANLTGINLIGARLTRADLSGTNLTGVNLAKANLEEANFNKANLTQAFLTWEDGLMGTNFTEANLLKTNIYEACYSPHIQSSALPSFQGAILSYPKKLKGLPALHPNLFQGARFKIDKEKKPRPEKGFKNLK